MLQKRLMKRTQPANNTLSGFIGSSTSDRSERSNDNQSVKSDGNNSETSDKKSGGSGGSNANTNKPMKNCPICKKAFTKATVLKKHIMSHSNAKPFKCQICNMGFFQECNLKRHMLSHNLQESSGEPTTKKVNGNHQSLVKTTSTKASPTPPVLVRSPASVGPVVRSPANVGVRSPPSVGPVVRSPPSVGVRSPVNPGAVVRSGPPGFKVRSPNASRSAPSAP